MRTTKTDRKLARRYGASVRTLQRWRANRAPVGDAEAMRGWLSGQRTLPAGTRKWLDARSRSHPRKPKRPAVAGKQGAAETLLRLESTELSAFESLQTAVATGEPGRIRPARQHWLAVAAELRRFDESVSRERRETDIVDRQEAEDVVASVLWWGRLGLWETFAIGLPPMLVGFDMPSAANVLRAAVDDYLLHVATAIARFQKFSKDGATELPAWARRALERELANHYGRGVDITQNGEAFAKVLAVATEVSVERALKAK